MLKDTLARQTVELIQLKNHFFYFFPAPPCGPATTDVPLSSACACVCLWVYMCTYTCMQTCILLQRRVDLCCLFNIAKNTTGLSHLGKQVIAISIIYSDIKWSRPQTILTKRLTEINVAAHKQAYPPPPPPIPLYRLHLFLFFSGLFSQSSVFSTSLSIICVLVCCFHFPLSVLFF